MGNHRSLTAGIAGITACLGLTFLAGCPTVDLGDTPTEIGLCNPAGGVQYFQDQIWPKYIVRDGGKTSCTTATCHTGGGNGLDFPMPGADPAAYDYPTAYRRTQIYLNCGSPEASQLLTKPLAGIDPHGGDDIFPNLNDPSVQIFLAWFK